MVAPITGYTRSEPVRCSQSEIDVQITLEEPEGGSGVGQVITPLPHLVTGPPYAWGQQMIQLDEPIYGKRPLRWL